MTTGFIVTILRWLTGLAAGATLAVLLAGIWQGTRRAAGRAVGFQAGWLRSPIFYLAASAVFLGGCVWGWSPLPWSLPEAWHPGLAVAGALACLPGLALLLWGRLTLGRDYFVSTGLGAQLFAGHQLVTRGPYAWVRHPMYLGLILAGLGSLPLYWTWTTLFFAVCAPWVLARAWREETALAAEFGAAWQDYCRRVPAILPRLGQAGPGPRRRTP